MWVILISRLVKRPRKSIDKWGALQLRNPYAIKVNKSFNRLSIFVESIRGNDLKKLKENVFINLLDEIDVKKVYELYLQNESDLGKRENSESNVNCFATMIRNMRKTYNRTKKSSDILCVARLRTFDDSGEEFQAFLYNGDGERYGLELLNWEKVLSSPVSEKSIDLYGKEAVVAQILLEMTFFGTDYESRNKRIEEIKAELTETVNFKEAKGIPAEKVFNELYEKFGWEKPAPKIEQQRAAEAERIKKIHEDNRLLLEDLCGGKMIY